MDEFISDDQMNFWWFVYLLKKLTDEFEKIEITSERVNDFPSGERYKITIKPEKAKAISFAYVDFEDGIGEMVNFHIRSGVKSVYPLETITKE